MHKDNIGPARAINKRLIHSAALASTRCNNSSRSLVRSFYYSGTRVYNQPYVHRPSLREMAVRTGNRGEQLSLIKDPISLKNNPALGKKGLRHMETHVQKCQEQADCSQKTCSTLCGTPGERVATEHWTHGNPQTSAGPVVTVSSTDYNGNPKPQNAVVYYTPEVTDLTNFVNNPAVKAAVEPYENIP